MVSDELDNRKDGRGGKKCIILCNSLETKGNFVGFRILFLRVLSHIDFVAYDSRERFKEILYIEILFIFFVLDF